MTSVLVLLAASALVGLILGLYCSWLAVGVSGLMLAIVSAVVLQKEGIDALPGIVVIVGCVTVNRVAYLIGVRLRFRGRQDQ
jgi:hypothetical protein